MEARWFHVIGLLVAAVLWQPRVASAQQPGTEEWFRAAWREASEWKPSAPLHIRATFQHQNFVDEAELARLRALGPQISPKDQRRLSQLEREAAHPSYQWVADVVTDGESIRYTATKTPVMPATSFVISAKGDWLLLGTELKLANQQVTPPEYGVRNFRATADSVVRATLWAGLGDAGGALVPLDCTLSGRRWSGRIGRKGAEGAVSLTEGSVALDGQPSINGVLIARRMLADETLRKASPLGTIEYSQWGSCDALTRPVVLEVRWLDGAGRATQTMKVEFVRTLTEADFASLLRAPDVGEDDPWIGKATITRVQDVRPGQESERVIEGGVERPVELRLPLDGAGEKSVMGRWYVAAGLLAAAVALAWLLRKR